MTDQQFAAIHRRLTEIATLIGLVVGAQFSSDPSNPQMAKVLEGAEHILSNIKQDLEGK